MSEHYHIVNLHAENVKRLKVVDITPDDNMVVITGKNGAGKSSVLDSIFYALCGKDAIPSEPVRRGEEEGKVQIDLGKYIVTRKFKGENTYIYVESHDGARYKSPQSLLDDIMGAIGFDPLDFTRQSPRNQYETLRGIVDIGVDIESIEEEIENQMSTRREKKRQLADADSQARDLRDQIGDPEEIPDAEIDSASLSEEIETENKRRRNLDDTKTELMNSQQRLSDLEEQLRKEREHFNEKSRIYDEIEASCMEDEELEKKRNKLSHCSEVNKQVGLKHRYQEASQNLDKLQSEVNELTEAIENNRHAKQKALENAEFPVSGLSLSEGHVYYNDVPFNQISDSEQITVATAIAMASNPQLRVIRIKDGSLLDDETMDKIRLLAREHDFQIWIERVEDDSPVAIMIEDGEVQSKPDQEIEQ